MFLYSYPLPHTVHFTEGPPWTQQHQDHRVTFTSELQNNGRSTTNGRNGLHELGNSSPSAMMSHQLQMSDSSLLSGALTSQHFHQLELSETDQKPIFLGEYTDIAATLSAAYTTKEKCRTCGEELLSSDLIQHMRNHMGPRRCEICNYEAPTKHHLREHLNTHTGLKPYKCQFCDKSFAAKNSLRVHTMYLHTKVRAHQCHFCDQRFVTTSERKSHELVHTDKCPICQMSFRLRGHLRQHMKSHANSAFHHKKR